MSVLTENTDEIIALVITIVTVMVTAYQAVMGMEITMPKDMALLIVGYYFGKRVNDSVHDSS